MSALELALTARHRWLIGGLLAALLLLIGCQPSLTPANPYTYKYAHLGGPSPDETIAFYKERVESTREGFLDRATLAHAYISKARWSGDPSYFEEAQKWAEVSLKEMPNPSAYLALAKVAEASHRFAEAVKYCEQVRALDRPNLDAISLLISCQIELGRADLAGALLEEVPQNGAAAFGLTGRVKEAQGKFTEAVEAYQQAIQAEEPQTRTLSALLRAQLGRALMRAGRLPEAVQALESALGVHQDYPLALTLLAELELQRGQPKKSAEYFMRVFAKNQEAAAWVGLGKARRAAGDLQEAEAAWDNAEQLLLKDLERGHYGHGRDLAELYLERGREEDLNSALEVMEKELETRRDAKTLTIAARALQAANRTKQAQELVQEATQFGFHSPALNALSASLSEGS